MLISDWSSDVCSSDLLHIAREHQIFRPAARHHVEDRRLVVRAVRIAHRQIMEGHAVPFGKPPLRLVVRYDADHVDREIANRKRVVQGKSVSERVYHGGRQYIKIIRTSNHTTS